MLSSTFVEVAVCSAPDSTLHVMSAEPRVGHTKEAILVETIVDEAPLAFPSPLSRRAIVSMLPTMAIDGVLPFLIYLLLSPHFASSSVIPLAAAALFPFLGNILTIVRHRRLDVFGAMVLLSLAASIVILLLPIDQRLLLITRSLMVLVWSLACLFSLVLPKPLSFYMLRQLAADNDNGRVTAYNRLWGFSYVRFVHHLLTTVFGLTMLAQFVIRVVLVFTVSVVQVLFISPLVNNGLGIGIMVWTVLYARHATRRLGELMRPPMQYVHQPLQAPTTGEEMWE